MNDLLNAVAKHWFWAALTAAVVVWYLTVTIYVAIRGMVDIRGMLGRLKDQQASEPPSTDGGPPA